MDVKITIFALILIGLLTIKKVLFKILDKEHIRFINAYKDYMKRVKKGYQIFKNNLRKEKKDEKNEENKE